MQKITMWENKKSQFSANYGVENDWTREWFQTRAQRRVGLILLSINIAYNQISATTIWAQLLELIHSQPSSWTSPSV